MKQPNRPTWRRSKTLAARKTAKLAVEWIVTMSKTSGKAHSGRHCVHSLPLQQSLHRSLIHPTPNLRLRSDVCLVVERRQLLPSQSNQVGPADTAVFVLGFGQSCP